MGRIRTAWKFWRSYRRAKRAFEREVKERKLDLKPGSVLTSRTTRNVAIGTGVSGLSAIGLLQWIRAMWPELLPWPLAHDATIAALFMTLVGPLLSRLTAYIKDRDKRG